MGFQLAFLKILEVRVPVRARLRRSDSTHCAQRTRRSVVGMPISAINQAPKKIATPIRLKGCSVNPILRRASTS